MPGLLKQDAECPNCGEPLAFLADTTSTEGVTREYFHSKGSPKARRKRRCKVHYRDLKEAKKIRRSLEV